MTNEEAGCGAVPNSSLGHSPLIRHSSFVIRHCPARRGAILLSFALTLAGCFEDRPAYHAPVWSPDGKKLYHLVARPDGKPAIHLIDLAASEEQDIAGIRFQAPVVALAPSPQGGQIALILREAGPGGSPRLALHVVSPDGKADDALWESPSERGVADLCWTPDGRALLVAADRPGGWALWLIAATGNPNRTVLAGTVELRAPTVSHDGRRVAFLSRPDPKGAWSLEVAALDGTQRVAVARALFLHAKPGYQPAWSPKDDALAFVSERYLSEGFAEIWLWDTQSGARPLVRTEAGACLAPAWSPSGNSIAFVRLPLGLGSKGPATDGRPADIAVIDATGKNERTLVADGLANLMPAWSPDGRRLAFASCGDPAAAPHAVRLADLDTGKATLALDTPASRFLVAWAAHTRGNKAALRRASSEIAGIRDPSLAAYAHGLLASQAAKSRDWPLAAAHAQPAAAGAEPSIRLPALQLLATARMRLGDPQAALEAAQHLQAEAPNGAARALCENLRRGLQNAAEAEADLRPQPSPAALLRLARAHLERLGNPRRALELCFRLLTDFPEAPERSRAVAALFDACEQLGTDAASHRVLARAAALVGTASLTPRQVLLLADSAAANGEPDSAVRWLDALPGGAATGSLRERVAAIALRAGEQAIARGLPPEALAAFERSARTGPSAPAAAASLAAARLLLDAGRHREAAHFLLGALTPAADPATLREALRILATARLQRRDPLASDAARVRELATFGFLESAIALAEPLLGTLPAADPLRDDVSTGLATAFERLTAYHLTIGDLLQAHRVVDRWVSRARRDMDLPKALLTLATCQRLNRETQAMTDTLSRIVAEFPDRPEAAEARRQLLLLNTRP